MNWSASLWFAAFFASLNLAVVGCGPTWPSVRAQSDLQFASGQRAVHTVDLLPLDVQVWTGPNQSVAPEEASQQLYTVATGVLDTELARRGYHVTAQIGWDGSYQAPGGHITSALSPEELHRTAYAMSGYGHAVAESRKGLLVPYLPHRLGVATGSQGTLYVGGWAYVGHDDRESQGAKVAKGVAIVLLIAVVIVIAIAALDKGGGKGGGGGGSGVARAAGGAGKAVAQAGSAVTRGLSTMGRAVAPLMRGVAHGTAEVMTEMMFAGDALGRSGTHIEIYSGRPDYFEEKSTPKDGPSRMHLEMTLIDNATGIALWHARQTFPANATKVKDVREVFTRMLATLPAR
ncbi:MAG: hypothetical protein AAGC55_17115 [Myxococcota bacterium]